MPKPLSSISERSPLAGVGQLFKKTSEKPVSPPPVEAAQKVRKIKERTLVATTVRLYDDQLSWLENLMYKAKRNGSTAAVSNSSLIRALLELCHANNLSLRGIETEDEIKKRLKKTFDLK